MKDNEQIQRRDTWRKIVDEYLASDMTQKAFCEQHNVSLPQFVYYHGKFRSEKEQSGAMSTFVPVKIPHHEKPVASSDIKLTLPNGFQCVFPSHVDVVQIRRLVEVLQSC